MYSYVIRVSLVCTRMSSAMFLAYFNRNAFFLILDVVFYSQWQLNGQQAELYLGPCQKYMI